MRYRNPHPHTAVLPAHVDEDGQVHESVSVEPGETIDWPIPVAGFEPSAEPPRPGRPRYRAARRRGRDGGRRMTQLSRAATLGIARELTLGQYLPPTYGVPFTKASFEDVYAQLKDESVRGDDAVLHGMYQGSVDASWDIECLCYPDVAGIFFRGMIGPDTCTPGVSTTITGGDTTVGANSISVTASIPAGSTIMIDTGIKAEYAVTGAPTGTGPYTVPLTSTGTGAGLAKVHTAGATVVSQATHLFKQSAFVRTTYSLTVFDTIGTLGFSSAAISDLQMKIDPKSAVSLSLKML